MSMVLNIQTRPGVETSFVEMNDSTNGFALMHEIKRFIDVLQPHVVSDKSIEFEFSVKIALDIARQFSAALHPAKSRAAPDAARHQLERAGAYLFACTGNTDYDGLAPTLMAAFQGRAHDFDVADTFERKINAPARQFNDHILNRLVVIPGIHYIGRAQLTCDSKFFGIDVDCDNAP